MITWSFLFVSINVETLEKLFYMAVFEQCGKCCRPNAWPPRWLDDREHSRGDSERLSVSWTSRDAWDSGCEEIWPSAERGTTQCFRSMSLDPPLVTAIMPQQPNCKSKDISTASVHFKKSAQNFRSEPPVEKNMHRNSLRYTGYVAEGNIRLVKQRGDVLMEIRREMSSSSATWRPFGFYAKRTSTSHSAVLLPSESLRAIVLFYLFVMLKHSTNGRAGGVNCAYLHLGNRQNSLQQNTVAKFI